MSSLTTAIAVSLLAIINPLSIAAQPFRPPLERTPEFLTEQSIHRLLQEQPDGQELGQRCGRNTQCVDTLECTGRAAKRCLPQQQCLQERLADFEQRYGDFEDYKALVLNDAGTSQDELVELVRRSNDPQRPQETFASNSAKFASVTASMHANLEEPTQELRTIFRECGVHSSNSTKSGTQDTDPPVNYIGWHLEGGLFLKASFSYIEARTNPSGYLQAYFRICLGVELGGGVQLSLLFGQYPEGTNVEIVGGGSDYRGIDLGFVFHASAGGGQNTQGFGYFEVGFGFGVGIGVGGAVCVAWPSDWEGMPPFPLPLPPLETLGEPQEP